MKPAPRTPVEAERRLQALLRSHGGETPGAEVAPAVCLHQGRMVTVSSATVYISSDEVRYFHAEGRPCEHEARDFSHLLAGPRPALERS